MRTATGARTAYPAVARRGARFRVRAVGLFLLPAAAYLATFAFYPFFELIRMSVSQVTSDNIFQAWPFAGAGEVQAVAATADFLSLIHI